MPDPLSASYDVAREALLDTSLSPEDVASKIVTACREAVEVAPPTAPIQHFESDTNGLELFLWRWSIWDRVVAIAEQDPSSHDRLVAIITAVRATDTIGCEGWQVWREPFSWAELPILGASITESEHWGLCSTDESGTTILSSDETRGRPFLAGDPPTASAESQGWARARRRWLNLNIFTAHLWLAGIMDKSRWALLWQSKGLELYALPPDSRPVDENSLPPELGMETAALWLRLTGGLMYTCRDIFGPRGNPEWDPERHGLPGRSEGMWDGVDGYHPDRWLHWKTILQDIANGHGYRPTMVEAARTALEAMGEVERQHRTLQNGP
ncbi:hypothetical protein C8Q78DRAFT_1047448 [Trametes maxima]|nr:hypothetical protein C8Q78DRAFT_1047448 [Trametes maxima]